MAFLGAIKSPSGVYLHRLFRPIRHTISPSNKPPIMLRSSKTVNKMRIGHKGLPPAFYVGHHRRSCRCNYVSIKERSNNGGLLEQDMGAGMARNGLARSS